MTGNRGVGSFRLRVFSDDRRFWGLSALVLACIAILKGVRLPGLWAATQVQISYQLGFVKRGLLGQIARSLGIPLAHYRPFAATSIVLLACFLLLLWRWIVKSDMRRLGQGCIVALFAGSYSLTYLTHMIGYLEVPSAALALVALARGEWRLLAALLAGVAGILIHENYLLTFFPVTLLPSLLARAGSDRGTWHDLAPIGLVAAGIGLIAALLALGAPMTAEKAASLHASIAAAADFPPREDFFAVLTRSAGDNVSVMMSTLQKSDWWLAQANAFLMFMPTAAFFIFISLRIIAGREAGPFRRLIQAAVIVSSLCPLGMQLLGWDIYRWYALTSFDSFLVLAAVWQYYSRLPGASVLMIDAVVLRNVTILLLAVNMATGSGLFDGYRVETFPFIPHWRFLLRWLSGVHLTPPSV